MPTWSAPVRYAEVDGQGVVFNSHYLLYCDEAMAAFCRERDLLALADRVQLVSSTLTWKSGARWGETIDVDVACARVGRTSFTLHFEIRADGRDSCTVETTYVLTDESWRPAPIPDDVRATLTN
ncbi:MAG TPA: thioesterase family protein [Jatrophihabitantaceae bacterium]